MKKIALVAIAILSGVVFTDCAAKKPVKKQEPAPQQQVDPQQAKLDSLRKAQEIRRIELEMAAEEAQMKADMEIARLRAENAKRATAMRLEQKVYIPCIDSTYDKHGVYMAGLGIAENQIDRKDGELAANRIAIEDIATRYIGTISNAVSNYAKDVNARSRQQIKESELEGEATAIGKKAIDKYAETVCRDFGYADDGTFTAYVAVHVPLAEVMNALQEQMQVLQVEADRARFREFVEKELGKQAAEKEAEQKQLEDLRQQMGL